VKRRIKLRREARQEFDEAAHWYWEQDPQLRIEFVEEIKATFERIRRLPEAFPVAHRDLRRAIAHRFPYAVYFRIDDTTVLVAAVIHMRRDPKTWQYR